MNIEELLFLQLLREIGTQENRPDRTGVGTRSIFAPTELRFSLRDNQFPLLTTRKMPLRIIFEELMWFLRGQTDVSILRKKNIHIWDGNTSREFLDSRQLHHYIEGDLGPSYSFQFRHFGAEYQDCRTDYTGQGFDQLGHVIHELKHNPTSRKIMINLWNPKDSSKMSLEPCAFCYQFYVKNGRLSCKLTQRSSDVSLAGGWNIASASLLTILLAHVCGLEPDELIWSIGDAHIYLNQLNSVQKQVERSPRAFPKLYIIHSPKDMDITQFEFEHLQLDGYTPHPHISFPMNV